MTSRFMLIFAAVSGFIFVALGAFGAHVLSKTLGVVEMGWIQTGLEYQAFHTLAIFGLAVAMQAYVDKLKAELADTMAMCGAHKLSDIKRSMIFGY